MFNRMTSSMTLFLFVLVSCFALMQTPAAAGKIKLNYANFPPAPTFPCVQMERWKTEVEKRTNGKVSVTTFPGGTLIGAKNMMDGVISGVADIGNLRSYQPGRFVLTNGTSLPLGIPDAKTGSLVLMDLYEKYKPKAFKDVKVLTMFTNAPANVMSTVAINSLDDLKGLDLRASGGAAPILKAWGANPVGMPMPATVEALQKGIVKGLFSSLEVMKDFKFAENCKYVKMTQTVVYPFAVVMDITRWNKLPDDVKKVMDDLKYEQAEWTGNYMDDHVAKAIAWSKESNQVEFSELTADETAQWNDKLNFLTEKWIEGATARGLPAEEIISDIKSLIKKHSSK